MLDGKSFATALEQLFTRVEVAYVHVRDTSAGCSDLRVARSDVAPDGSVPLSEINA